MSRRADHVVVVGAGVDPKEPRQHGLCRHCGERLVIELPVRVDVWAAATRAFIDSHADCRPKPQRTCNGNEKASPESAGEDINPEVPNVK